MLMYLSEFRSLQSAVWLLKCQAKINCWIPCSAFSHYCKSPCYFHTLTLICARIYAWDSVIWYLLLITIIYSKVHTVHHNGCFVFQTENHVKYASVYVYEIYNCSFFPLVLCSSLLLMKITKLDLAFELCFGSKLLHIVNMLF